MTWFCASGPRPENSTILRAETNFGHVGSSWFLWQHWPTEATQDADISSGTAPRIGSTTLSATLWMTCHKCFKTTVFFIWWLCHFFCTCLPFGFCLRKNCRKQPPASRELKHFFPHLPTTGAAAGTNLRCHFVNKWYMWHMFCRTNNLINRKGTKPNWAK